MQILKPLYNNIPNLYNINLNIIIGECQSAIGPALSTVLRFLPNMKIITSRKVSTTLCIGSIIIFFAYVWHKKNDKSKGLEKKKPLLEEQLKPLLEEQLKRLLEEKKELWEEQLKRLLEEQLTALPKNITVSTDKQLNELKEQITELPNKQITASTDKQINELKEQITKLKSQLTAFWDDK